jgi:glycosyltransferase involved in cell wall biosynthesis
MVARWRGALLVNWLQDLFPEVLQVAMVRANPPGWLKLLQGLRNRALRRARANVVLGRIMAERVNRQGIRLDRIHIIENWSDGARIRPVEKAVNPLRHEWGLEDKFVVGYSGNLGVAHEFESIMGAAEALSHREDIAFLFVGAGKQLAGVRQAARERNLSNVQFQPYQPQERLAESLSVPDVHLVCLRPDMEGLVVPSKFYGVLAAGRPCIFIGDPSGELALSLLQIECGTSVPSDVAARLAELIGSYASLPEQAEMMGRRARAAFESHFDRPRAVEKWVRLLAEL